MPKNNTVLLNMLSTEKNIGKINTNNNVFSVLKPKTINSSYINQIVKFSKNDALVRKFTHDSERFKNTSSFARWYQKGKILYLLLSSNNNLMGIIWFGKSAPNFLRQKLPDLTFAIRIYKPARGLGLAKDFFWLSHKDLLNTLKMEKQKYTGLWLKTSSENQIAIHLYKKLGFKFFKKINGELIMTLSN